ncbi:MATE family efflux transporter [Thaumasiovibrio sp. DFM-14]|uniref:MATE family efflux transporter n=1 Tax=Thaumasiovibrio sp. DFM-14 TaxID=3384792 RepID=UPI0039A2990C
MKDYLTESKHLLRLALPVLLAQVAQTSMGFVDTIMAGGVSATDMAAVAVASSIWLPTMLFGLGVLQAIVPIVAQLFGAGKKEKIRYQVQQGVFLALFLSVPLMLVLYNAAYIVDLMDIEADLSNKTIAYLQIVLWAMPAILLFTALRGYCEGLSFTSPAMFIGFIGLLANIPLNWIFVYGHFGAPALGAAGCAVATLLVYWLMAVCLLAYIKLKPKLNALQPFSHWQQPHFRAQKKLFNLGLPVALAMFFEVTMFACVAIFLAPLGSVTVAAHQIAVNFSSMIFMIPLSLGIAASIRVGHRVGQMHLHGAKITSYSAIAIGFITATVTAILSVIFRHNIALIYNDNPEVLLLAGQLMLMAAIYQISDAVQVIAAGALRGYKDMQAIFVRTFIAYWLIGLPLGYVLGRTDLIVTSMGPYGFWAGTIVGLTVAALLLGQRLHWLQKQDTSYFDQVMER